MLGFFSNEFRDVTHLIFGEVLGLEALDRYQNEDRPEGKVSVVRSTHAPGGCPVTEKPRHRRFVLKQDIRLSRGDGIAWTVASKALL